MKTKAAFILYIAVIITVVSGNAFGAYSGGTGEPNNPYQIVTKADLLALAADTNDYSKCFILTADVNMEGQVFTKAIIATDTSSSSDFQGTAFTGEFDGSGHKITHFTISGGSNQYLGLFGYIDSGGCVKNLGLENFTVSGSSHVGGLVGLNHGSISNSYTMGSNSGSSCVGGLVGDDYYGSISNCYSTVNISGSSNIGGLVGHSNRDNISSCYSRGNISGSSYVGGLVGKNDYGSILNSFWDTQTSGQATSAGGIGKTTTEMQDANTFLNAGWDFINEKDNGTCNYWQMPQGGGYPELSIFNGYIPPEPLGSGTEEDPYIITDANDLGTIWYRPWACYKLANDINLAGIKWSCAVVPDFNGVFDGNGFSVRNLDINSVAYQYVGLFGWIENSSIVKNLGIENCTVNSSLNYVGGLAGINYGSIGNCYSTGNVSGSSSVGGLAGYSNGSISNCYSTGAVSGSSDSVGGLVGGNSGSNISNCYSTGVVSGASSVGGLVGNNNGLISNCYSTCAVSGSSNVGGLMGYNYGGSISNCYSTGNVSGYSSVGGLVGGNSGLISNCYSTGAVSGISDVGGLVGFMDIWSVLRRSFWDTQTSGQNSGFGGTGKTTAEMQDVNTFLNAGWDFINEKANGTYNCWQMPQGGGYPVLSTFNGYIPSEPLGSGTEEDPYIIADANDLGTIWYRPWACYKLINDIDLAGIKWSDPVVPKFSGVLDGNGFCIRNLDINSVAYSYIGLFGQIETGARLKILE